ncbi:hypothetical protein P3X46_001949 [Hevea brasiliensis]|uniref:RPW8 domain-containing protein n=1 Tax=Hevea brasiliensis TaxID=3981 RepID=A0ABQ9N207_HEVBR|nr:hypothetical protein P3X46_001949 [Hevea brasiliensis]
MAAFTETPKAACHLRPSSLPSKTHPLVASVAEQLTSLRTSSESLSHKLGGLKDLFERVDDLVQLPLTQRALCHEYQVKRKKGAESIIENEVRSYMNSRKRLSKVISKCCGNLKKMEKNCTTFPLDKDSDLVVVVRMLKDVEEISLTLSRPAGWSIVSKLLQSRQVTCQEQAYANEVEKMDAELLNLIGKITSLADMQKLLKGVEALESSIHQSEEELECIYRRLLKSRVSLLNMHNH